MRKLFVFILIISLASALMLVSCTEKPQEAPESSLSESGVSSPASSETLSESSLEPSESVPDESEPEESSETSESGESEPEDKSEEESEDESFVVVPIVTSKDPGEESNEASDTEPVSMPDDPDFEDVNIIQAMDSLNVKSVPGKSVVCYSLDRDDTGAYTILVVVNQNDQASAVSTTYYFYPGSDEFNAAADSFADKEAVNSRYHLIKASSATEDPVGEPSDYIFVSLFGYHLY